ncbi:MAG TPA: hypothetical protein ENI23_13270 [bacterium]|nr:hypothetical protein [bacterium]
MDDGNYSGSQEGAVMISWEDFSKLSIKEQLPHFLDDSGALQSLVCAQQLDRETILKLILTADVLERLAGEGEVIFNRPYLMEDEGVAYLPCKHDSAYPIDVSNTLKNKSCCLYFTQPSSRTLTSFSLASQSLGMGVEDIRDPQLSSMNKGESKLDTVLTLASLSDVLIMRQEDEDFIWKAAHALKERGLTTRLINAGSGSDQHPTQALLDMATILSHIGLGKFLNSANLVKDKDGDWVCTIGHSGITARGITPRDAMESAQCMSIQSLRGMYTIVMVGDLRRSRTARSLSYMLSLFPEFKQVFIALDELQIKDDIIEHLSNKDIIYDKWPELATYLSQADVFYMMRLQDEYKLGSVSDINLPSVCSRFYLSDEKVQQMKESACILHPLPRREEIPVKIDLDKRAKYWETVKKGKYIRMALLMCMLGERLPWILGSKNNL